MIRQRRVRALIGLVVLGSVMPGCHAFAGSSHSAEIVNVPIHAEFVNPISSLVLHQCNNKGACLVEYSIRVSNGGDQPVSVLQCGVDAFDASGHLLFHAGAVIGRPAGVYLPAGATRTASGGTVWNVQPADLKKATRAQLTCQAWDWHGNAPI